MPLKNLKYAMLYDCYGSLLSEKQSYALEMYYCDDLSLSEISEHMDITRQGVRDLIKHGEQELDRFEKILGLYERNKELLKCFERISECAHINNNEEIKEICKKAISLLDS